MAQSSEDTKMKTNRKQRFQIRESLLKVALKDPTHRSTFSAFMSISTTVFTIIFVHWFFDPNTFYTDMGFLSRAFAYWYLWPLIDILLVLVYSVILLPGTIFRMKNLINNLTYTCFCLIPVAIIIFVTPIYFTYWFRQAHPVLKTAIFCEQMRHIMKFISFVVENMKEIGEVPEIEGSLDESGYTEYKKTDENGNAARAEEIVTSGPETQVSNGSHPDCPTLESLVYFIYAPTLIYQKSYPRSPGPAKVLYGLSHLWALIFLLYPLLFIRNLNRLYEPIGKQPITVSHIIEIVSWNIALAGFIMFAIGFLLLNQWLNIWAEILRFGDRQFYTNWWCTSNAFLFMSRWNLIVQSWISEYLYKPYARLTGNRPVTIFLTLFTSFFWHDYLISIVFGFVVPFFTLTGLLLPILIPIIVFFVSHPDLLPLPDTNINTFSAYLLSFAMMSAYSGLEYHARLNCPLPPDADIIQQYVIPRIASCLEIA